MAIQVPPQGTYGARRPRWIVRKLMVLFMRGTSRVIDGRAVLTPLTRMFDFPVVLLSTVGARSGRERVTALGGFSDGDGGWLVMAVGINASAHHPPWLTNMAAHPDDVWLEVGKRKLRVRSLALSGEERTAAVKLMASVSPHYGKYQENTDREIPVVRLTPSGGS